MLSRNSSFAEVGNAFANVFPRSPGMLCIPYRLNKLFWSTATDIDLLALKLHYRATTAILMMFSVIIGTRQLVGNPIDCDHIEDIPEDVLDTFCWIHLTYTVPAAFGKEIGKDVVAPGIGPVDGNVKVYPFYQWVLFCLCFQVCLRGFPSKSVQLPNFASSLAKLFDK